MQHVLSCRGLSNRGAGANTLKSLIGLGVLNLPWATRKVGWLASVAGMAVVCAMTVYGIFYAVKAKEKLGDFHEAKAQAKAEARADRERNATETTPLQSPCASPTYRGCGLGPFDPVVQEVLGLPGLALWAFSVNISQVGTAIAYITVILKSAESLGAAHAHAFCALGILLMVLSTVKRLQGIAYFSCIGLLVYSFVLLGLIWESGQRVADGRFGASVHAVSLEASAHDIIGWFGIVAFAFGGLPVSLSIYEEMSKPEDFFKVTSIAFGICWAIYASVGALGYACYGNSTDTIIFFNFAPGSVFRVGSVTTVSVILILTYVIQMVPVYNFAQSVVGDYVHWLAIRLVIVAFTMVVAHFIPSTVTLISITGAFASAMSCFVLPPLVYISMKPAPPWHEIATCICLIILGCVLSLEIFVL